MEVLWSLSNCKDLVINDVRDLIKGEVHPIEKMAVLRNKWH